ncbi:MAG: xylulokinase [Oscillospiraceae bacterium]|jgi:xylulokinase|nr:xylulokinase [Oscillospiraceae bacterium]
MHNYYLGIDIGTTNTKALLMDATGAVVRTASREYALSAPRNGWAEQDPQLWLDAAYASIREVLQGVDAESVKCVGLTGQMHGLVALDGADNVLRPAILWCDQRTASECAEITERVGASRLIELTANPALTGFTAPKILWMRHNEPELYAKIAKIMLPKDYVRYALTGDHASDLSDASGTGLLNVARRDWEPEVLQKLDIPREWLAKLYESPEITGAITASAAERTGLIAGTPVVAGAGDNAAAAIGTGVASDGAAFVTIGSSGVVFAHTSAMRLDPHGRVHTFCAAVPHEWHVMGVTLAAGLSLKWFRDNFAPQTDYTTLDTLAESVPVGANRLIYAPYLNGERTPHLDPAARGAFVGLSSSHGVPELARAVMEGVTYSLRDCYAVIEGMGARFDVITACGGGSVSAFWRAMLCDALGVSVDTAQTSEGPALGAAMLAAVGAGEYATVADACDAIIKKNAAIEPNAAAHDAYSRVYEVYKTVYTANRGIFAALETL